MPQKDTRDEGSLGWLAGSAVVAGIAYATHGTLGVTWRGEPPHDAKTYRTLSEFYPFYLQEHRDPVSRGLHVFGSSIVLWMVLSGKYRSQLPNFIFSFAAGSILCEYLSPLPHGLIEFVVMLGSACVLSILRKQPLPWKLAVTGYFFAWVGHFFFEHNRPATFIYPSYSLLCDFRMWYQALSGQLPLSERL